MFGVQIEFHLEYQELPYSPTEREERNQQEGSSLGRVP